MRGRPGLDRVRRRCEGLWDIPFGKSGKGYGLGGGSEVWEKSELGGWVRYLGVFFFFFLAGKRRCGGV